MKTMKKVKLLLVGLAIIGLSNLVNAQTPETTIAYVDLDEIILSPIKNVTYYDAVYDPSASAGVKGLETAAAKFDITSSDLYGKYESYLITFKNHAGNIRAVYNNDGELLKSIERFENVKLTEKVRLSLLDKFPDWKLNSTVFRVKYANNRDLERTYHLQITKGSDKMNIKVDGDGEILRAKQ